MLEQRIDRHELEKSCFTRISLPSPSTLGALLFSLGINVGLLLALTFSTDKRPASQEHFKPLLIKAVLVQPTSALRMARTKPKSVSETSAGVAHSVDIKEAKQGESNTSSSNETRESEEPQKPLVKESSVQLHAETQDVRLSIREETQDYIKHLNEQRLHDIANPLAFSKSHTNMMGNAKVSKRYNTEDEAFLESIEIVVDCNTVKGKIFSFLSKNKGGSIEDRDLPSLPNSVTAQGTVKCRDNSLFNEYINRRVNK